MLIIIIFSKISFLLEKNMIQFVWKGEILMILEKAYAKLNLFLDVESKRLDGYHNIVSVMQTVDWCDDIYIKESVSSEILLRCNSRKIPCGRENTAYRAAAKYLEAISEQRGVEIEIRKRIPTSAGMAGGSADAAAVLRGMNRLFGARLSEKELLILGKSIGADVPFCILGGTKIVRGIGEEITFCESAFPKCLIVCAKLGEGISTPQAYRLLDEKYEDFQNRRMNEKQLEMLLESMKLKDVEAASRGFFNIFEESIQALRPAVAEAKQILLENGAYSAMMSGSGPSVFGLFHGEAEAESALKVLQEKGAEARICRPI